MQGGIDASRGSFLHVGSPCESRPLFYLLSSKLSRGRALARRDAQGRSVRSDHDCDAAHGRFNLDGGRASNLASAGGETSPSPIGSSGCPGVRGGIASAPSARSGRSIVGGYNSRGSFPRCGGFGARETLAVYPAEDRTPHPHSIYASDPPDNFFNTASSSSGSGARSVSRSPVAGCASSSNAACKNG